MAVDASTGSLLVGDGWGVAHRAVGVRRLELDSGVELAAAATRSRAAEALLRLDDLLWVSTDRRLLALDPLTLELVRAVDYSGVSHAQRLIADSDRLVASNWLSAQLAVFDRSTGNLVRRRVGKQPSALATPSGLRVYSAAEGGYRTFGPDDSMVRHPGGPAVTAVASDRTTWGVVASERTDDQGLYRHPSTSIVRLDEEGPRWEAPRPIARIHVDDERTSLWLVDAHDRLLRMDQVTGKVTDVDLPGQVRLVDAVAGLVITGVPLETPARQFSLHDLDALA